MTHLLGESRQIKEVLLAEDKSTHTVDRHLRRRTLRGYRLARDGGLSKLEFEVAADLIPELVGDCGGKGGSEAGNTPVFLHKITAEALNTAVDDTGGLNALGGIPAEPVVG